jgi:hypothetical protein
MVAQLVNVVLATVRRELLDMMNAWIQNIAVPRLQALPFHAAALRLLMEKADIKDEDVDAKLKEMTIAAVEEMKAKQAAEAKAKADSESAALVQVAEPEKPVDMSELRKAAGLES